MTKSRDPAKVKLFYTTPISGIDFDIPNKQCVLLEQRNRMMQELKKEV